MSVIVIKKEAKKMKCQRCGHDWLYTGRNPRYASCPRCRTTVIVEDNKRRYRIKRLQQIDSTRVGHSSEQSAIVADVTRGTQIGGEYSG
jgi:DNA-directed RNA polymerase subunit RPC12/RpoP